MIGTAKYIGYKKIILISTDYLLMLNNWTFL